MSTPSAPAATSGAAAVVARSAPFPLDAAGGPPAKPARRSRGIGSFLLKVAALAAAAVVVAWLSAEGARFPRDGADVVAFYQRSVYPMLSRAGRVLQASVDAGAKAARTNGDKRVPSPAELEALVRSYAAHLALCNGDARPRTIRVTAQPSGRVDALTAPDDDAARCMQGIARSWRVAPFEGAPVTFDVVNVKLGARSR